MAQTREPAQLQRCFVRAEDWLLTLAATDGSRGEATADDLGDLLRILFGVWLCERATQEAPSPPFLDLTERVEDQLRGAEAAGAFNPFAYDAKLLLLCHRILAEQGRQAFGITGFARALAAALGVGPTVPLRYAGEALLLAQLSYAAAPPRMTVGSEDLGGDPGTLLRADGARIRAVCDTIAAATQFGVVPLRSDGDVRAALVEVLPIVLIASLRRNDLDTGAALLRAIRYLRLRNTREIQQATMFVADQQQGDGKFGYFAVELAAIARARPEAPFDALRQLYLPVTVSCLWSLAETVSPVFSPGSPSPVLAGRDVTLVPA